MKRSLEKRKAFPLIAWGTFIIFTIFVFYLTTGLQTSSSNLQGRTEQNLEALENTP